MTIFKEILKYTYLVLSLIAILICSIVLPEEGKTVEYRLQGRGDSSFGEYPKIIQVIENGMDSYIYFPELTMEEGMALVTKLNEELKNK